MKVKIIPKFNSFTRHNTTKTEPRQKTKPHVTKTFVCIYCAAFFMSFAMLKLQSFQKYQGIF